VAERNQKPDQRSVLKQDAAQSRRRSSAESIRETAARVSSVLRACAHWRYSTSGKYDVDGVRLVRGHYSRRKPNSPQFMPPGETIVLVNSERTAVWGWWRPHPSSKIVAMNGRDGWTCSVFSYHPPQATRPLLASELVLDAERALAALERDGLTAAPCGPDGMLTYVDARKVRSSNPGYCYKLVGWVRVGRAKKASKPLLWKPLELAGIPACGARRHERVRPETRAAA
jgi:hypothetical protein